MTERQKIMMKMTVSLFNLRLGPVLSVTFDLQGLSDQLTEAGQATPPAR